MKLLIIHGPNTNLIGVWSAKKNKHITLDKVNREIRKYIREKNITLKIIQTNKEEKAVSYIQKYRKGIDGIILVPGPWQFSSFVLSELLNLLQIPFITISYKDKQIKLLDGIENYHNEDIYSSFRKAINKILEEVVSE